MRVVVTGGAGFLGGMLVRRLLQTGGLDLGARRVPLERLVVLDARRADLPADARLQVVTAPLSDAAAVADALAPDTDAVWHLASVVSAEAEVDLDKGLEVNVDGTRRVLEAARRCRRPPRLVFASSVAAFGGDLPPRVDDRCRTAPRASYGVQKAIGELLVGDFSRRGLVDGRSVRIPTVSVRPGAANRAASGFASAIIREPLAGRPALCPVSPALRMWLASPRSTLLNLLHALALDGRLLGGERTVNLPGISVRVADMLDALRRVAGEAVAARVDFRPDPAVQAVVGSWPGDFRTTRAAALGFVGERRFEDVVRQHLRG